jgi:amino acid adenylation domain-containing protein
MADSNRFDRKEIEQSVPDRLEKQVDRYPDRVAVRTRSREITYKALNHEANRLARAILDMRGDGEERIALVLENDTPMIVAMLGVLKAGKTYVPLDPLLPEARINYILEDSQASLIVTNNANLPMAEEMAGADLPLINTDLLDPEISPENPALSISPDTPVWILYTSGSTGQPKGVVQTHRNVLHYVMNYTNGFQICPDDRFALLYSCSVNAGAHMIYSALLNGASLYPLDLKAEGLSRVAEWLIQNNVTIYSSVPTIFLHFIDTLTEDDKFPDLRLIIMFGEPVYRNHVELYKQHFSQNCIFVNRLGSTETGSIRWYLMDMDTQIDGVNVPVGYPVEDNEILLLDDDAAEVEPGQIGEIAVRSRYLSPGYWRKPDRTEAAFLPDPEGGDRRIYRTGDLGQMLPDGRLVHLGRKDFQVKIKGYRIEVVEIETALLKHDAIKKAAVWPWEDGSGNRRLVAYLVLDGQETPAVTELREMLLESLPAYMIPSYFMAVDALPLAPNGKLNRRALPVPDTSRPKLENPFVPPGKPVEEKLAEIWRAVLGFDEVGIQDNFSDLGGESLMAVQILNRIQAAFGRNLPLSTVFQFPTIEKMANILEQPEHLPSLSSLVPIQPEGSKPPLFCVHGCLCEVLNYFPLAHHLGTQQPVYAFRARGIYGEALPHRSVEDMAAHYIREMKTVQSEGPYRLCGAGAGGLIGFEMAKQLLAQDQEVSFLAIVNPGLDFLVDSSSEKPAGGNSPIPNPSDTQKSIPQHIRRPAHSLIRGRLYKALKSIILRKIRKFRWKIQSNSTYWFLAMHISYFRKRIDYMQRVRYAFLETTAVYVPRAYTGRIIYILSEQSRNNIFGKGYKFAFDEAEVRVLPGDYGDTMQEPGVRNLAKQLENLLDEAL